MWRDHVSKGTGQFLLIPFMAVWATVATVAGLGDSLGKMNSMEC